MVITFFVDLFTKHEILNVNTEYHPNTYYIELILIWLK